MCVCVCVCVCVYVWAKMTLGWTEKGNPRWERGPAGWSCRLLLFSHQHCGQCLEYLDKPSQLKATIWFPLCFTNASDKVGEHTLRTWTSQQVDTHTHTHTHPCKAICCLSTKPWYRTLLSTCTWQIGTFNTNTQFFLTFLPLMRKLLSDAEE